MGKSKKAKKEEPKEEVAPAWLEKLMPLQEQMAELQNTLDKQVTDTEVTPRAFQSQSHFRLLLAHTWPQSAPSECTYDVVLCGQISAAVLEHQKAVMPIYEARNDVVDKVPGFW